MIKAVKAIIYFKNKYLLQLRDKKKNIYYPNFWGLFGGTVEKKETSNNAITREIFEETNLKVIQKKFLLKSKFNFYNSEEIFETTFFECKTIKLLETIKINEGQKFNFFSINQLKSLKIIPYDLLAITYHNHSIVKKKKYILD